MKRGLFLLLAASVGLNAGLFFTTLYNRGRTVEPYLPPAFIGDQPPPPEGRQHGPDRRSPNAKAIIGERLRRLRIDLQLNDHQHREMRKILESTAPGILAGRDAVQEARRALRAAYDQDPLVPEQIRAMVTRQSHAQARVDSLVAESFLRESEVLSPEQRVRYLRLIPWDRNPARRPGRGGPRREGGPAGPPERGGR